MKARSKPRHLFESLKQLDKNRIVLTLEMAVPPLAFLGLMSAVAASLSPALYASMGMAAHLCFQRER